MWPFKKKTNTPNVGVDMPTDSMRCGTPYIQSQSNNPNFYIRSIYVQTDGSKIIEDEYPYNGRRETRVEKK